MYDVMPSCGHVSPGPVDTASVLSSRQRHRETAARSTRNVHRWSTRSTRNSISIDAERPSVLGGNDIPSSAVAVTGVMALSDQGEISAEADPMDGSCRVVGSK